jgi:hypothetical protein
MGQIDCSRLIVQRTEAKGALSPIGIRPLACGQNKMQPRRATIILSAIDGRLPEILFVFLQRCDT